MSVIVRFDEMSFPPPPQLPYSLGKEPSKSMREREGERYKDTAQRPTLSWPARMQEKRT